MKNQDETSPVTQDVDQSRRRLTKAGLAAPAVLGVLASRRVLGNEYHHCTPSGHISGFASPNPKALSCDVGHDFDYYASSLENWPPEFLGTNKKPLLFSADLSVGAVFDHAYQRVITTFKPTKTETTIEPATFWDVLKGHAVDKDGVRVGDLAVVGDSSFVDLELGREAVTACMNALNTKILNFPISAPMVINMFNGVFDDGIDNVTDSNTWNKDELTTYFKTLQG